MSINQFGIAFAGLVSVILVSWFLRKLPEFQEHANGVSDMRIGWWWKVCLGIITPIVLGYMFVLNVMQNIQENYEGLSTGFLLSTGIALMLNGFNPVDSLAQNIKASKNEFYGCYE